MADSESILQLGIEAARAGDKAEARELFRLVTREDPNNSQGWLWLAGVAQDREEKRAALEQVITLDPNNDLARKGLAALGPAPAETPVPVADVPAPAQAVDAPAPVQAADTPAPEPSGAVPPTPDAPQPVPTRFRARRYDIPATAPAAGAVAVDDTWTTPTYDEEEYDLQDYRQPRPAGVSAAGTTVVVEDEEPQRRGGLGWLPLALGLAALLLLGVFAWSFFNDRSRGTTAQGSDSIAGATTAAPGDTVEPGLGTVDETLPPAGTDTTVGEAAASPLPVEETPPPAQETPLPIEETPLPAEETAPPPAQETAPPAEEPAPTLAAEVTAPADEETTIVVVPPGATVVPTPEPPPAPAPPPPAPPPAPAPPGDVAAANPAIVPSDTVIQAGQWNFTYNGIQNIVTDSYGGAPPTRGEYQIVLLAVANNGDQPVAIPDGFFVLKDAQGRVYDFNRAASVEYFNRFGGAGVAADQGADAQFPNNGVLTSVPLLFDVPPDATNLVLFSRDNLNQGFQIR